MKERAHQPDALPVPKRSTRAACPWVVCQRCGLVYLKNAATRAAVRAPCPGLDDPSPAPPR